MSRTSSQRSDFPGTEAKRSDFASQALRCVDVAALYASAVEAAQVQADCPIALWAYSAERLTVQAARGFPGVAEGMFRAEVTQFRPEGQAVVKGEVVVRDRVIAAPIFIYGRGNGVIAAYFDRGSVDTQEVAEMLSEIAAVTSLAQERLYSQQQNLTTQKLVEVGRITNGILHEIANPLQFVMTNLQFLQTAFEIMTGEEDVHHLEREFLKFETASAIERSQFGMQRLRDITVAMKTFSNSQQSLKPVNCNEVVSTCLLIAQHELTSHAVTANLETPLPAIEGDEGALGQVMLNLVMNAKHALDDAKDANRKETSLRIETSTDGAYVYVKVRDTGLGIPRKVRSRIWEPFFTTKQSGVGTGQGLPLVRSIVEGHRGQIDLETNPSGTTFLMKFPVIDR
jgi:signal transduction histidine kinase